MIRAPAAGVRRDRRYVADAGPLLERLHRLMRADVATRNRRKAACPTPPTTIWRRGPVVGETYRFLLDLRMERGPLGEKPARQALRSWWAVRGER